MLLRNVMEPDLKTAELNYPKVLSAILAYTNFCDEHGDENLEHTAVHPRKSN